jgi:hypothetical protein
MAKLKANRHVRRRATISSACAVITACLCPMTNRDLALPTDHDQHAEAQNEEVIEGAVPYATNEEYSPNRDLEPRQALSSTPPAITIAPITAPTTTMQQIDASLYVPAVEDQSRPHSQREPPGPTHHPSQAPGVTSTSPSATVVNATSTGLTTITTSATLSAPFPANLIGTILTSFATGR